MSIMITLSAYGYTEDNISALEYAKYGINYPNESLGERLNRLETDYFGMSQSGNINSRIENLTKIYSNAKNGVSMPYYGNYSNNYNTENQTIPVKKRGLRNFFNNITSSFLDNGYVTGYTPSMNYSTNSGYTNNLYGNNAGGYMNNPSLFCPYPQMHNRNPIKDYGYLRNRFNHTNNFNGVNRLVPYSNHNRNHNPRMRNRNYPNQYGYNPYYYNPYNRPYTNRTSFYTPPNIETKSSIHILKD